MDSKGYDAQVEALLEKKYWVIDFLPRQVPAQSEGQYFQVEAFYWEPSRLKSLYERFGQLLIQLSCYYAIALQDGEGWGEKPAPADLLERVASCATNGYVLILLPTEDTLITLYGNDLYMTVYNPSPELLNLLCPLAGGAGLFLRPGI